LNSANVHAIDPVQKRPEAKSDEHLKKVVKNIITSGYPTFRTPPKEKNTLN